MTQEEFDALDDTHPAVAPATGGGALAILRSQGPVRLAALGLAVIAAGAFGATTLMGGDPVQVTQVQSIPGTATGGALPVLPQAPAAVAAISSAPIRRVENVEPTQAILTRDLIGPMPAAMPGAAAPEKILIVTCDVVASALPLAGALIALDVSAPCDAGARVDVLQGDLQIAVALDTGGTARMDLPALSAAATIAVVVAGRAPVSLLARTEDIGAYTRAVLHWDGNMALELHAFEGSDADYGTPGHVSPQTPHNIARALSGNGGYITALGDASIEDAKVALVYTAPADVPLDISLEAPVTDATCGRDIFAGTIRTAPDGGTQTQDLMLTMPACDGDGGYVMLGSLTSPAPSLDLASN